jgi:hypothetical protein
MIRNPFEIIEKERRKPHIDDFFNKKVLIEIFNSDGLLDETYNNYREFSGVGAGTKVTIIARLKIYIFVIV